MIRSRKDKLKIIKDNNSLNNKIVFELFISLIVLLVSFIIIIVWKLYKIIFSKYQVLED